MPEALLLPEVTGAVGGGAAAGGAGGGGGLMSMLGGGGSGGSGGGAGGSGGKGAAIGLATGLLQQIQAAKLKKKADAAMPGLIDPRQAAFLSELNQKRKAIDTGADFGAGMNAINSTNAATNNAIIRSSGGDVSGTIQGLLQSEQAANNGKNGVLAQGEGQQLAYNSMFNDLNNKIAARQLQLELQQSQQARAEWAQKQQSANQNLMAGISGAASLSGSGQPDQSGGNPNQLDTSFLNK